MSSDDEDGSPGRSSEEGRPGTFCTEHDDEQIDELTREYIALVRSF